LTRKDAEGNSLHPQLVDWAATHKAKGPAAPRAQSLDQEVMEIEQIAQTCEADPGVQVADDEIIRQTLIDADREAKEFLEEIQDMPTDYQLWYLHEPKASQAKHRKAYKALVGADPKMKRWFFNLPLEGKKKIPDAPDREYRRRFKGKVGS